VLAQMLEPRLDQERFEEAAFLRRILEYAPGTGAVAAALLAELFERGQECMSVAFQVVRFL
jgi:hypothetical protein